MGYRVVLVGPPASGKGTQAAALSAALQVAHVSTGQLFRDAMREGGSLGDLCRVFIDKGQLVPDEAVIAVVEQWLARRGNEPEFIFDGFPRTRPQAEAFDARLRDRGLPLPCVILLDVPEEVTIRRVAGRRSCENCGALYHVVFDPPQQVKLCDRCGGPLIQRADDTEATVRERLRVYRELTLPVVEHYREAGALRRVDGLQGKSLVFAELLRMVRS
jgi:adenylate kinase